MIKHSKEIGGHWSVWQSVYVLVCPVLILGFLWARRLLVLLVLRQVQQFQVGPPLPSLRALHEDPVHRSTDLVVCSWMIFRYQRQHELLMHRLKKALRSRRSPSFQPLLRFQVVRPHRALPVEQISHILIQFFCFWTQSCKNIPSVLHLLSNSPRITNTTRRTLRTLKTDKNWSNNFHQQLLGGKSIR